MKNYRLAAPLLLLLLNACAFFTPTPAPTPASEKLMLHAVSYGDLPGWSEDRVSEVIPALRKSCDVLLRKPATTPMGVAGRVQDWRDACSTLKAHSNMNEAEARSFLTEWFVPYEAKSPAGSLFTGYYEPEIKGSFQRGGAYQTPLWKRPSDMIDVNLGDFKDSLKGQKVVGKVSGRKMVPFDDRQAVSSGSLQSRAEPLVWVDDPITAFFLEIQGSGRVHMADGSFMRIGYDAQNGHPFIPIGRVMAEDGLIEKPVTMRKIRAWLQKHPDRAQAEMNKNPSVVFFRRVDADGAVGAQGVVLTALRSMAVDPAFVPLGTPLWVVFDDTSSAGAPRLVIAQDTGGAIKGAVRGDFFCGTGSEAENRAGSIQSHGVYYLLIPRGVTVAEGRS